MLSETDYRTRQRAYDSMQPDEYWQDDLNHKGVKDENSTVGSGKFQEVESCKD
jgi:hypothetical protein